MLRVTTHSKELGTPFQLTNTHTPQKKLETYLESSRDTNMNTIMNVEYMNRAYACMPQIFWQC